MMKISVVIPAFNEEKLLPATLRAVAEALAAFDRRGWQREIVVCDNNSTDRTAAIAAERGARVVFEPVNQISRARNCGAAAATGDWLIFVDADSTPSPALFDDVAECILGGRSIGGGVTIHYPTESVLARLTVWGWNGLSRTLKYMAGSFIFCEAAAFRALGGFSLELFVAEEIDLSQRLKKYARRHGKRVTILNRHPLTTSIRKLHLYTLGDHVRFVSRLFWRGTGHFKKRENCHIWYDGRR